MNIPHQPTVPQMPITLDQLIDAKTAFNASFDNALLLIKCSINNAISEGHFSCDITFDREISDTVIETLMSKIQDKGYEYEKGVRSLNGELLQKFITISWADVEGGIKKDDND